MSKIILLVGCFLLYDEGNANESSKDPGVMQTRVYFVRADRHFLLCICSPQVVLTLSIKQGEQHGSNSFSLSVKWLFRLSQNLFIRSIEQHVTIKLPLIYSTLPVRIFK